MRIRAAAIVGVVAATSAWAGIGGAPSGAAVTGTSSGTTATFTSTAGSPMTIACTGGNVAASGIATSPALACSGVTTLTLLGDGSGNYVSTEQVGAAFPNLGSIVYSLQGGQNLVFASTKRDVVVGTNTGQDVIYLPAEGAADDLLTLSTGTDTVNVEGTAGDDAIDVADGGTGQTVVSRGAWSATLTGTEFLGVAADTGDDTIDAVDLGDANLTSLTVQAGPGDDSIEGGDLPNVLGGGTGANSLVGGPVGDTINSTSASDVIEARGGLDTINDQGSGRVGDRFIIGPPSEADNWILRVDGDVAIRSRAGDAADSATVVAALGRTGLQELGPNTYQVSYQPDSVGAPDDRALFDVAALPGHPQRITSASANTVVDLVVPTGSWTRTGGIVSFTGPYEDVIVPGLGTVNIRSPFTDPEERFAHRLLRDLEMRIPSTVERSAYRAQLESGGTTRAQLVQVLSSSDVVRAIAVDRAFVDILRRTTDAPGRAYWVNRLRSGLVTRRMRANLYGSNEYFAAQGDSDVEEYVRAAYLDILGRDAEESGLGYWVGLIEGGAPRGTVADRFLNTSEARTVLARDLFLRWVDRGPTAGELSTWLPQLGSSSVDGETALIRFLAGSSAYFTRPDA